MGARQLSNCVRCLRYVQGALLCAWGAEAAAKQLAFTMLAGWQVTWNMPAAAYVACRQSLGNLKM